MSIVAARSALGTARSEVISRTPGTWRRRSRRLGRFVPRVPVEDDLHVILVGLMAGPDQHPLQVQPRLLDSGLDRKQRGRAPVDDEREEAVLPAREEASLDRLEPHENQECQHRRADGGEVEAAAHGEPDGGDCPDTGGRGQTANDLPLQDDRPRSQEADPAHHLGCDARRVQGHLARPQDVREPKRRHEHEEGRPDPHQRVRPQPGGPLQALPLQTDDGSQNGRHDQSNDDLLRLNHRPATRPTGFCSPDRVDIHPSIFRGRWVPRPWLGLELSTVRHRPALQAARPRPWPHPCAISSSSPSG